MEKLVWNVDFVVVVVVSTSMMEGNMANLVTLRHFGFFCPKVCG